MEFASFSGFLALAINKSTNRMIDEESQSEDTHQDLDESCEKGQQRGHLPTASGDLKGQQS